MPHHRPFAYAALSLVLGACLAAPAPLRAEEIVTPMDARGQMLMWIKDAEDKLLQLAEATPEAKYSWRPGKGVRSTAEVFLHVAAANFGLPGFAGIAPPAGFSLEGYEQSLTKKGDVQKALRESFAHLGQALAGTSEADLEKPVEIPVIPMKTNGRGLYLLLLTHAHEHLGQAIAYARSNGVVPPWTARQQEAMKAKAEKN